MGTSADFYVGTGPASEWLGSTITAGPVSRRRPGGIIELPYLDGVQHLAVPEVTRG